VLVQDLARLLDGTPVPSAGDLQERAAG